MTPILLTKPRLLKPISAAIIKLDEINNNMPKETSFELHREGLFVLAVSTVEVMLSDTLLELFRKLPAKLPEKAYSVSKDLLLSRPFDLVENLAQSYVLSLSYKKLDDILDIVNEHLATIKNFRDQHGDSLQEIKESRNLLLHNNLKLNAIYKEKAGKKSRHPMRGERLSIDPQYFLDSITTLKELCIAMQEGITEKYSEYTRIAAVQRLWNYIFQTPIMPFEKFWALNKAKDEIIAQETDSFPKGLSNSEKIFLGVWLSHFNSRKDHPDTEAFNLHRLDSRNQQKMLFLISALRDFKLY